MLLFSWESLKGQTCEEMFVSNLAQEWIHFSNGLGKIKELLLHDVWKVFEIQILAPVNKDYLERNPDHSFKYLYKLGMLSSCYRESLNIPENVQGLALHRQCSLTLRFKRWNGTIFLYFSYFELSSSPSWDFTNPKKRFYLSYIHFYEHPNYLYQT